MKDFVRENTRGGSYPCNVIFLFIDQFYSDKTLKDLVIFQLSYFMIENISCRVKKTIMNK